MLFNVSFFFFVAWISFDLLMKQEDQVKAEATLIAYETLHYPWASAESAALWLDVSQQCTLGHTSQTHRRRPEQQEVDGSVVQMSSSEEPVQHDGWNSTQMNCKSPDVPTQTTEPSQAPSKWSDPIKMENRRGRTDVFCFNTRIRTLQITVKTVGSDLRVRSDGSGSPAAWHMTSVCTHVWCIVWF